MKIRMSQSSATRNDTPKLIKRLLLAVAFSFTCLAFVTARGFDEAVNNVPNPNSGLPAVTGSKFSITTKDGTVLVGTIPNEALKFTASHGPIDVRFLDIVNFNDGFLTLTDGSKLKGSFHGGTLPVDTARGRIQLSLESITGVVRLPAVGSEASGAPPVPGIVTLASTVPALVGKVFDNFGKPLPGVSVTVRDTKFSSATDKQGNYSLGYVPGSIHVEFSKQGYYPSSLQLQIATAAQYPVKDIPLYEQLPSVGIFHVGESTYVKSFNKLVRKDLESQRFSWSGANTENQYFVTGDAVSISSSQNEMRFVIDLKNTDVRIALYRVKPGTPFLRRVQYGIGDIKFLGEAVDSGVFSEIPKAINGAAGASGVLAHSTFKLWTGHLGVGSYVFVTLYAPDYNNFTAPDEPCYFFQVGGGSSRLTSTKPGEESVGGIPQAAAPDEAMSGDWRVNAAAEHGAAFDSYTKELFFPYDKVWDTALSILTEQKEEFRKSSKDKGILETQLKHPTWNKTVWESMLLKIEKASDTSTKLSVKICRFTDVVSPDGENRLLPSGKSKLKPLADAFLGKVQTRLQTTN